MKTAPRFETDRISAGRQSTEPQLLTTNAERKEQAIDSPTSTAYPSISVALQSDAIFRSQSETR